MVTSSPKKAGSAKPPKPSQASQLRRIGTRGSGAAAESLATTKSNLGKRSRKSSEKGVRMSRELRRLQDTNEFAHIDERPVMHTVWSNGKYVDPDELEDEGSAPPRKRAKTQKEPEEEAVEKEDKAIGPKANRKRAKKWLEKGLYAGQQPPADVTKTLTTQEKKKLSQVPRLAPSGQGNKSLPLPMFNGLRMLINGRDFKLPYDVCNPLPPGQPKPPQYRTMAKNRFVGDAAAYWKKTPHLQDYQSKCICRPEDGCAEQCQNRIMLYECDDTNCNIGKAHCTNRAFQNLTERTKRGGRFRVGVEVVKTSDRGFGVRSNRCFQPREIIMEYVGEIITEEECDRRMNEIYKDNECYYLMSFDQKMIIDATSGSMARFVNHSCSPNCEMIKWVVSGQPRMALFAGSRPIMTGEELTYDYNFSPFSKDVQKCLCGSANCRGVLGPKPREIKPPKPSKAEAKKSPNPRAKAGKRKLKELLGAKGDGADLPKTKKRKIAVAKGAKRSSPAASKAGKGSTGAAAMLKRRVSTISVKSKGASTPKMPRTPGGKAVAYKSSSASIVRTYGKNKLIKLSSKRSSLTLVAAGVNGSGRKTKGAQSTPRRTGTPGKGLLSTAKITSSGRKRTPSRKSLEAAATVSTMTKTRKSPGSANSAKSVNIHKSPMPAPTPKFPNLPKARKSLEVPRSGDL